MLVSWAYRMTVCVGKGEKVDQVRSKRHGTDLRQQHWDLVLLLIILLQIFIIDIVIS